MVTLVAAFQFLTTIPPIIRRAFTPQELGGAVGFYPVVGVALGGVLLGLDDVLNRAFSANVAAVLVLVAWLNLTRALHFDGFLDMCDGLFGGFTPERRMEIMRDSRVGAFGVAGGIILLLLKYSAVLTLIDHRAGLLLAPTIGRWGMTLAVVAFPYARETGLGRHMKDHAGARQLIWATSVAIVVSVLIKGWTGLIVLVLVGGIVWGFARYILRLIPGFTGDLYGALCELLEAVVLILFTVEWAL